MFSGSSSAFGGTFRFRSGVLFLHGGLAVHLDAAFFVDTDALGGDHVARFDHVLVVDAEVSELADWDWIQRPNLVQKLSCAVSHFA